MGLAHVGRLRRASTIGKKPKTFRNNTSLSRIFKRGPPPPPQPGALYPPDALYKSHPFMTTQTPTKKWASRMAGVMRRALTGLINPARPGTPGQEHGSRDVGPSEDDAASTTGKNPKKSRSNTSLSDIFRLPPSPPPPQPGAPFPPDALYNSRPLMTTQKPTKKWVSRMGGVMRRASTIDLARPGTPDREAVASQEETLVLPAPDAAKSSLLQEVKLGGTSSADQDPGPVPAAPVPQPQPQASASPIPA